MVRETEISTQYQIVIYEMIPMKGVYLLKTDKGNKCLKKINYGQNKLLYIYKAKDTIQSNGFSRIDKYFLTADGSPYAMVNEDLYIMTDWIDGKECDFKKEDELRKAAENLAEFHSCARGFEYDANIKMRNDIGKLVTTYERRVSTLNKMRDIARKTKKKSEFDLLYLANVEYFMQLAKAAVREVDIRSYGKVCQGAMEDKVLCHHDYTYHNILIDASNAAYIVDFDYCKEEVQIYDLSTLIVKALKRVDWNPAYGETILRSYDSVRKISMDEMHIMKTMLRFPQRFWRLSNRYYYREAGWSEATFLKKMREIVNEKEKCAEFVDQFDDLL